MCYTRIKFYLIFSLRHSTIRNECFIRRIILQTAVSKKKNKSERDTLTHDLLIESTRTDLFVLEHDGGFLRAFEAERDSRRRCRQHWQILIRISKIYFNFGVNKLCQKMRVLSYTTRSHMKRES